MNTVSAVEWWRCLLLHLGRLDRPGGSGGTNSKSCTGTRHHDRCGYGHQHCEDSPKAYTFPWLQLYCTFMQNVVSRRIFFAISHLLHALNGVLCTLLHEAQGREAPEGRVVNAICHCQHVVAIAYSIFGCEQQYLSHICFITDLSG